MTGEIFSDIVYLPVGPMHTRTVVLLPPLFGLA